MTKRYNINDKKKAQGVLMLMKRKDGVLFDEFREYCNAKGTTTRDELLRLADEALHNAKSESVLPDFPDNCDEDVLDDFEKNEKKKLKKPKKKLKKTKKTIERA